MNFDHKGMSVPYFYARYRFTQIDVIFYNQLQQNLCYCSMEWMCVMYVIYILYTLYIKQNKAVAIVKEINPIIIISEYIIF